MITSKSNGDVSQRCQKELIKTIHDLFLSRFDVIQKAPHGAICSAHMYMC